MASANVDLARSILATWERGVWSSAEWAHHDICTVAVRAARRAEVTRIVVYMDRERALADLGLGPEGGSPGS
jgi:hypothetical protein